MSKLSSMKKRLAWESKDGTGREILSFKKSGNAIVASSSVIGNDIGLHTSWEVSYSLICDVNWHARSFIADEHKTDKHLQLFSKGDGLWEDENKNELKVIAGCIDIDFRPTPFSNTLPIRRLKLHIGESATIDVVYVDAPDLAISRERQIYTRLSDNAWRFEQPSANFKATITVDDEGFITNYPGLFSRIEESPLNQ